MIPTKDDIARECLEKLHAICDDRGVFPSSYIISYEHNNTAPLFLGDLGYWHLRGTYRGEEIEMVDMADVLGREKEVCTQYCVPSQRLLKDILGCCRGSPI